MRHRAADPRTALERGSEREIVATRTFNAPVRLVFDAWTEPTLFERWWGPETDGFSSIPCEMDVHTGGACHIAFGPNISNARTFFGRYLDASPAARLVWTNDETDDATATTVTFDERAGRMLLVLQDRYHSKEALEASFHGMEAAMAEHRAHHPECERLPDMSHAIHPVGAPAASQGP